MFQNQVSGFKLPHNSLCNFFCPYSNLRPRGTADYRRPRPSQSTVALQPPVLPWPFCWAFRIHNGSAIGGPGPCRAASLKPPRHSTPLLGWKYCPALNPMRVLSTFWLCDDFSLKQDSVISDCKHTSSWEKGRGGARMFYGLREACLYTFHLFLDGLLVREWVS